MEKIRSFLSVSIVTLLIFLLPTALLSRPFTDNGDGTVRAADTSLYWQRCAAGQSGADCSGDATRMQWQEARSYCSTLRFYDVRGPVVNQSGPEYNRGEAWIRVRCLSDKSI